MHLQTILFSGKKAYEEDSLYIRKSRKKEICFNTYFNSFSFDKWKKYTKLDNLYLALELQGYCEIRLISDSKVLRIIKLDPEERKTYEFIFPFEELNAFVWFELIEDEQPASRVCQGWYCTNIDNIKIREVNLAIDICTYKREDFVKKNLLTIKEKLLNSKQEIASHLEVFIIDNGKTLNKDSLEEAHIHIFSNKNLGGTGGFTRGLLEILERKKEKGFTHVIFMDDDAKLEPDAVIRTYALLRLLKSEYEDITIGGAILRSDYLFIQHAAGERWERGKLLNPHQGLDLRDFASCVLNEEEININYAGWWYCCWSLNTANEKNLPLPMFIHLDDVEYGIRNQETGFLYLNGISVWHDAFQNKKPSMYAYYELRNNLLIRIMHPRDGKKKEIIKMVLKRITGNVLSYRYRDVELNVMAVRDVLRGIDWLKKTDGELLNQLLASKGYEMQLVEKLTKEPDVIKKISYLKRKQNEEILYSQYIASFDLKRRITFNGWFLPACKKTVPFFMGEPLKSFYRIKELLLFDPDTNKGILVRKSFVELIKAYIAFGRVVYLINKKYPSVAHEFQSRKKELEGIEFWRKYLEI